MKSRLVQARWLGLLGLSAMVACGGGGSAPGETAFTDGPGEKVFGEGGGSSGFGSGAGNPPFGGGSGGGPIGDGPRPDPDPAVVISDDDLQGTVFDARTGAALAGASVDVGSATLTTAADGFFSQEPAAAASRLVLGTSATNHETLYTPTEVLGSVPSFNLLGLTPHGTTADIIVADGGSVTDTATGAAATLPANALSAVGGGAPPATVGVRVTPVAVGTDPHLLSGDFTDDNGNRLEAFGALHLGTVQAVEVAAGQQIALNIPVSTRSTAPPSTANLYRLEPVSGRWVQQGTVSITSGTYNANVDDLGQWMVGAPIASPVQVSGCVIDDTGAAAANVRMELEGISYSGTAQVTTASDGSFTLPARPSSRVIVSGRRGAFLTNSVARDVTTSPLNITPCLTLPLTNAATMRLTWGEFPRDIDSHLRTPDGSHVFFAAQGSLTGQPFASLDVDDVTGFGPEVTTIRRPKVGIYRFYLHNYSQSFNPGMTGSPTRVELNYAGRSVVFTPPPGEGSALYWHLFDLSIAPNCTMTLYRYNRWRADEPQNPNTTTTTTECVPG